jgi:cobalt-zinc-cadmium efflux system protein
MVDQHTEPHHDAPSSRSALLFAIAANGTLLVAQAVVGLALGSLALLADSLHNASDVVALVIALVGVGLAARPATTRRSYGLARAEVLAALFNGVVLLALTIWVVVEAVSRFSDPHHITAGPLALIGALGLMVNGGSAWFLHRTGGSSLNIRAALWHLLADALGSLGVVIAAAALRFFHAEWADPAASILISLLILAGVLHLLRDTVTVLLEATPGGVDPDAVVATLTGLPGVVDVHHIHIWAIDSNTIALTAHVAVAETDLRLAQAVIERCRTTLRAEFRIDHATLEAELEDCADPHHEVATGTRNHHSH